MIATDRTVKDIVTGDFRAAGVFERHRIDFCCGGGRPLADACRTKGVDVQVVLRDLEAALAVTTAGEPAFDSWELDSLADYIVRRYAIVPL